MKIFKTVLQKYLNETSGVNAVIFALVLPAMVAAGGLAVDLANAYNVRNKLAQALDKAALATANSTGSENELREIARNFVHANFRDDGLGTLLDPVVTFGEKTVTISANAHAETMLMKIFGKEYINVGASSEVTRELSGIEVALVLDVTGSMAGSNIRALKNAASLFVNKMFDEITNEDLIKIGLVPFSSSVNVGPYGLGENPDGSYYGSPFVVRPDTDTYMNPNNIDYNPRSTNQWHGCVLTEPYPDDTLDNTVDGFGMYRYPRRCTYSYWGSCYQYYGSANTNCPRTPIVPLTNDQDYLLDTIDDLYPEGNTYGNVGMIWGWRVLSPEEPFTEGVAYDDSRWEKAVIMMTDGENTMDSWYSAYGLSSEHNLNAGDLNERFEEICENMKEADITVYTITFQSGVGQNTKAYFERCATTPSFYSHAPDNEALEDIFEDIANQLSKLHISK